ncbi:MAG: histone deacetylase [Bacteroidota bacterium]|nr:histone deacetylase [Bacteroidota bacterium]MDX5431012.1 histone deacetylase [Bacteroidota bacterium]MDX5469763.1 histone deacetylase [Bacteroidota bacterium]
MRIAWSPCYAHPLPEGHRFPMDKYTLIPEQLVHQGIVDRRQFFEPSAMEAEHLELTHTRNYVNKVLGLQLSPKEMRKIGFPLSAELVAREQVITQGTYDCALFALDEGAAMNVAGGTHHAYADSGEGFCIFNDFAVAASRLLHEKKVGQILVVDLDVHQGNGTASIFQSEPRVFTFSMHGKDNYPLHKESSDLDIPLQTGTTGEAYLEIVQGQLPTLTEKVRPDLVFYVSGVDVLSGDKLGKLSLSKAECRERDRLVAQHFAQLGIPLVAAMGGGYSPQIGDIVDAHCATFDEIQAAYFG